jgi:Ca-activated chloride channel family protein
MTVLTTTRFRRPGWGSWLALLLALTFTGICAVAWVKNESIVAWLLAEGVVNESATTTLPSTIRQAALGVGLAGLVAALFIALWGVSGMTPWAPVQALAPILWKALKPLVSLLWPLVGSTFLALRGGLALLLHPLRLGFSTLAQAGSRGLRYLWLGLSAVVRSASLVARLLGLGVVAVARPLGLGVSSILQAISTGLRYAWLGIATISGYLWLAASKVARLLGLGGVAVAQPLGLGVSSILRAVGTGLRYAWLGISTIAAYLWLAASKATSLTGLGVVAVARPTYLSVSGIAQAFVLALRYAWSGLATIADYLWRAASKATSLTGLGVVAVARPLGLGVSSILQAISTGLRYAWLGIATISGYLWLAASKVARLLGLGGVAVARPTRLGVSGIARAIGAGLRYGWLGMSIIAGYLWLSASAIAQAVGRGLGYVWLGMSIVAIYSRVAASGAARLLRLGVVAVARPTRLGVSGIARANGAGMRYTWLGIATIAGYLWLAASKVARLLGQGVIAVARPTYLGVSGIAQAVRLALCYGWLGMSTIAGCLRLAASTIARPLGLGGVAMVRPTYLGVSTILQTIGRGLRSLLMGLSTILGYLRTGVATFLGSVTPGIYRAARSSGLGAYAIIRPFLVGASIIAQAVGGGSGYVWLGVSAILRYLWLGIATAALALGWAVGYPWRALLVILQGLRASPLSVARTVGTACGVLPDVGRTVVWLAIQRKEVHAMSDFNLTGKRLFSLVVTLSVLAIAGMIAFRFLSPPPPEPTVEVMHWTSSHLQREGETPEGERLRLLPPMAAEFNQAGYRTRSGKRIVVKVHNVPSSLQSEYLISQVNTGRGIDLTGITDGYVVPGYGDPTIVTPSSAHWLVNVNYHVGHQVVDLSKSKERGIVGPVIGIVTYEEMARCLGWPGKEIGYQDILDLRADPRGWQKYACAKTEWGQKPLVAYTDPSASDTGRSLYLALYSFASRKAPEQLTLEDVNDKKVRDYMQRFYGLVDHYLIGTTVMNSKIHQGVQYGHFFVMPEDNLIHLYDGTEKVFVNGKPVKIHPMAAGSMVMIYPKEGSMPGDNCACIVQADWVTEEQAEAAQKWIDFIREPDQQRSFMAAGFRPGPGVDLSLRDPASKIIARYGLDPDQPKKSLSPALIDPQVAAAIDQSWELVKRPGIVTLVMDTSGSMIGSKIKEATDGAIRFVDNMAKSNQVGFVSFDNTVNIRIPVAPWEQSRFKIAAAVQEIRARGETALYDAIKAGIEMTDDAEGPADAIRAVVVLTDGRANRGQTKLHDLIEMSSRDEVAIREFPGFENDTWALQKDGQRVQKEELVGTGLALETDHPIQVFFIGIGEDADLDVGRMLAEATGAEFQGVAEEDLANVLEEFSKYF